MLLRLDGPNPAQKFPGHTGPSPLSHRRTHHPLFHSINQEDNRQHAFCPLRQMSYVGTHTYKANLLHLAISISTLNDLLWKAFVVDLKPQDNPLLSVFRPLRMRLFFWKMLTWSSPDLSGTSTDRVCPHCSQRSPPCCILPKRVPLFSWCDNFY